jgi:hypothetical protein
MTTLHLGVIVQPYDNSVGATTGMVAEILEDKYHVMEVFFESRTPDITKALERSIQSALDQLDMNVPVENINPFSAASGEIETAFRHFLDSQEIESLGIPGVPTQAALDGVRTSYKNPTGKKGKKGKKGKRAKRSPRPSFIDTGLYNANMKVWFT